MFLMVAASFGPHWAIDRDEAKRLNTAVNNVTRHYLIFQSERSRDWGALMVVSAQIAGPRLWQTVTTPRVARQSSAATTTTAAPFEKTSGATPAPTRGPAPPSIQTPSQLDPGAMAASHATAPV